MIKEILIVEDDVRTRNTIEKFCCSIPIAEGALFIHADNGKAAGYYVSRYGITRSEWKRTSGYVDAEPVFY